MLHRNKTRDARWISIRLVGEESNRMGIGVKLVLKMSIGDRKRVQYRWMLPSTGSGSQNAPEVHFGLGVADRVESLEIVWPSGVVDRHGPLQTNHFWIVTEGEGVEIDRRRGASR